MLKDRLKTHDPATIKGIIEGRMNVEIYVTEGRLRDLEDLVSH